MQEYLSELHEIIIDLLDLKQKTLLKCFGSARLGLVGNDIDCLLITPPSVTRDIFFTTLSQALEKDERFSDVRSIANAYVPLIKFTYKNINFDLLHCVMPYILDDETFLFDDSILKTLDVKSLLSLNGFRTTEKILKLVPNVEHFLNLLTCVKLWAKKRTIYSNIMGYWGGITWTIAVAKICQLYDNEQNSDEKEEENTKRLFQHFLCVMANWEWPTPLTIAKIDNDRYSPELEPWDPSNNANGHQCMPVLTPAYPSKNSSYNVMRSTASLMKKEFKRAYKLSLSPDTFQSIFDDSTFLTDYNHYLVISPTTVDKNDYNLWKGYVESKIKTCVKLLESSIPHLEAIPYSTDVEGSFYIALSFKERVDDKNKKLANGCEAFLSHLLSLPDSPYVKGKMDITVSIKKNK